MSSELETLYQQVILDHARRRSGFGLSDVATARHHELNPTCGDEITVGIALDADGAIQTLGWEGQGCSISMASASVLSELCANRDAAEVRAMIDDFRTMLRSRDGGEPPESLEDAVAFQGVARFVMRIKCAMLGWVALEACLDQLSTRDAAAPAAS